MWAALEMRLVRTRKDSRTEKGIQWLETVRWLTLVIVIFVQCLFRAEHASGHGRSVLGWDLSWHEMKATG
jgi:hypothetical protein